MSEEETTETPAPEAEKETGKGLRAQLEKTIAAGKNKDEQISDLKSKILATAYTELGLDPATGLGKAIAKEYDGETSLEALAEYAKSEYDYEATPLEEVNPQAQQIALGHAALDQVGQTAGSIAPPTNADALAKAEAEGDYATAMQIKGAQLADSLRRNNR